MTAPTPVSVQLTVDLINANKELANVVSELYGQLAALQAERDAAVKRLDTAWRLEYQPCTCNGISALMCPRCRRLRAALAPESDGIVVPAAIVGAKP